MCGISALVDFSHPIPPSVLQAFNRALIHRGPDNQSEMLLADGRAGLGHCRLSIVDTSEHANQPFVSQDKRYVLVFNGEIYNYVELRTELEANGVIFSTSSDTEVLLHAFEMWQEDCLQRFNGMWAFVIWDNHTRRLFMSRDRFGVKPLYFRLDKHGIAVASEQKAFAAHPGGLVIDPQQAARFALCPEAVESTSDTLYQHVQKLLPGEYAWFSEMGFSRHRWWHTYTEIKNLPRPACREELLALFQDACQVRTRTDVNIAVALSGGLDSSAVTGTLCTLPGIQRDKKLTAFVGSFPDTPQDEYKWAKMVTDHYRLPSHRVAVDPSMMANSLVNSSRSLEDVNALPVVGQWHVYQGMQAAGFKVSIEGHGGDELLAGYYRHLSVYAGDLLRARRDPLELAYTIGAISSSRPGSDSHFVRSTLLQAPQSQDELHTKLTHVSPLLKELFGQYEVTSWPVEERNNADYNREDLLFQKLYEDFHYYTLPYILKNYDRLSMANSVEIRSPFLDYRFVLAAFKAGAENKIHRGQTKALLRQNFTQIPAAIRQRRDKSGFTHPPHWLCNELAGWLTSLVSQSRFIQTSLFDGPKAQHHILQSIRNKDHQGLMQMWPIINLAILEAGYDDLTD